MEIKKKIVMTEEKLADDFRKLSDIQLKDELNRYKGKAEELFKDDEKVEGFLQDVEKKVEKVPVYGDTLSRISTIVSMIRAYILKNYRKVPKSVIIGLAAALVYFVAPVDVVPDVLGPLGYVDDAGMLTLSTKIAEEDINEYKKWQIRNGRRKTEEYTEEEPLTDKEIA